LNTFSKSKKQCQIYSLDPDIQNPRAPTNYHLGYIAVRTGDFRLAYRLLSELKSREIKCIQLLPSESIPSDVAAWLASPSEVLMSGDPYGIPATLDTFQYSVDQVIHRLRYQGSIQTLTFGVDPGPRPGIAWIGDGLILGKAQLEGVDDAVDRIMSISRAIEHESLVIRVGNGSKTIANRIINTCMARGLFVQRVDESRTSVGVPRHAHSSAALRIARLPGRAIKEKQRVCPTNGEIRDIQRRSRKESRGRTTIPSDLARAVAVGRLTIDDAIRRHIGENHDSSGIF
jgi:hypothetical protein